MMAAVANGFNFAGVAVGTGASPSHSGLHQSHLFAAGDDIPNDPGKMFIGGLSWQTTPESIREYFSSFGELAEVMVMKDPATRRSRGFGFITFSDPRSVEDVLKYPVHQLDGKLVEPKVAVPRKTNPKLVMRTRKIFVGGLSATTSLEDIKAYFEQFSTVKEAMLAYDKVTSRHRGFGFVTFDNEDVVDKICEIHFHEINGKMVESKKALPKEPRLGFYGSPSGHIGYGHYSPGRQSSVFGAYGGYVGSGTSIGSANSRFPQGNHHQYSSSSGYNHRGDHQDRPFLQMGQFDNANFAYDSSSDMRYYNGSGSGSGSVKYGMGGSSGSSSLHPHLQQQQQQQRQYGVMERSYDDLGSSGGGVLKPSVNGFGSYRESRNSGMYDNVRSVGGGNHSLDIGGSFGDMLSNGYYSTSSRDFPPSNSHHVSGGSASNGHTVGVQPYSTSAGSGGSGENSNGYEDDFPELTASKFNNLRLDDTSPASTPNDLNQNIVGIRSGGGSSSAFVAF